MRPTLISARNAPLRPSRPRSRRRFALGLLVGTVLIVVVTPRLRDRQGPLPAGELWRSPDPSLPDTARVNFRLPPDGPVRGLVEVDIEARDGLGVRADLRVDGVQTPLVVEEGEGVAVLRLRLDTSAWPDGLHTIAVTLRDRAWPPNTTLISREIETDNTAPTLLLARSSQSVGQGRTLGIYVRGSEPLVDPMIELGPGPGDAAAASGSSPVTGTSAATGATAAASTPGGSAAPSAADPPARAVPTSMIDDTTARGLTGISVKEEPGPRALRVQARDAAGNVAVLQATVTVTGTTFRTGGVVELSETQREARHDKEKGRAANDKRREAYADPVEQALPGTFIVPVTAPRSSAFGKARRYPDGSVNHHLGTDFAASLGSPVGSSAEGVVTLAEPLHLYGNAVIVGHGAGVSTSYSHLSRIDVRVGDRVAMGQTIGLVGSTGQSTGAHLHWGMVVDGTAVAAEEWTTRRFELPLPGDFGEPLPR